MERTSGNGHHQSAQGSEFPPELVAGVERAREQLGDLNRKALDLIQRRPIPVLIGAFCVGLLIGRLASRR